MFLHMIGGAESVEPTPGRARRQTDFQQMGEDSQVFTGYRLSRHPGPGRTRRTAKGFRRGAKYQQFTGQAKDPVGENYRPGGATFGIKEKTDSVTRHFAML